MVLGLVVNPDSKMWPLSAHISDSLHNSTKKTLLTMVPCLLLSRVRRNILEKHLPMVKDSVKGAKLTKDLHGIVFDVPCEKAAIIEANWVDKPYATLQRIDTVRA